MFRQFIVFCLLSLLASSGLKAQSTLQVPSLAYPTIQSAIDAASSGDTLQIAAGTYQEILSIVGKHLTLIGAGMGQTVIDGGGIGFTLTVTQQSLGTTKIEHLDIKGGNGIAVLANRGVTMTGFGPVYDLWFNSVDLHDNDETVIHTKPGIKLRILSSVIRDNGTAGQPSSGRLINCSGDFLMMQTEVRNNHFGTAAAIFVSSSDPATFEMSDCVIADNSVVTSLITADTAFGSLFVGNCQFRGNTNTGGGAFSGLFNFGYDTTIGDCLFERNSCQSAYLLRLSHGGSKLLRSTLAKNVMGSEGRAAVYVASGQQSPSVVKSCIFSENSDNLVEVDGNGVCEIRHCLLEGGYSALANVNFPPNPTINVTNSIIGLVAAFRDPVAGDYSLLPGSPAVDSGVAAPGTPATDLNGDPRVIGSAIDMGCFELQNQDPGPDFAGTVASGDLLFFNGSSGGVTRSATVDAGSMCTVAVNEPAPGLSAPFILWGYLGVPQPSQAFSIFFAGGNMAFTPHLVDIGNLQLFTFTNNLILPPTGLVPSTAAPWAISGPALPFPFTMTIQGLIVDGSGPLRITNAITLHTR